MAAYHFRNLIFEGGGVRGIAYIGALQELKKRGILQSIERVGGTSAGAITAVLVGLGYSIDEMREVLWSLDFNKFKDSTGTGLLNLIFAYGWYKGKVFRNWIRDIIRTKTGNSEATFADIYAQREQKGFKDIYLIGSNLSTKFCEVFSYKHTPELSIADATRISMSIPLFFIARRLNKNVYVDGGVLRNYPIKLFDREEYIEERGQETGYYEKYNQKLKRFGEKISKYIYNKETLGFRLDSDKEIAVFRDHGEPWHKRINNFFSFAMALIETILESQQSTHLHSDDWQRTIYIDTLDAKTTEFDLSDEKKDMLIEAGAKGVRKYFDWYDNNLTVNK